MARSPFLFGATREVETMDTKRTSQVIDSELQAERSTIKKLQRELDATKKERAAAEGQQEQLAYKALAGGDKTAQKNLDDAEERLAKAERHIRSYEKAIAQAIQRFEQLEREWHKALADEAWAELMAEAELARKEAEQIDVHASALAELLGVHGRRLEQLKSTAHNLGFERAFNTVGVRHFDRVFAWKMIKNGFVSEYEKPSQQYREASGYSDILNQQIAAAQASHDSMLKEHEGDGQGGGGLDHESQPEEAEGEAAGAQGISPV